MTRMLASLINLAGVAVMVAGLVLQRRALACHGRPGAPSHPFRPVWNCLTWFQDPAGVRMYILGDALFSWGMMVVCGILGYMIGRW